MTPPETRQIKTLWVREPYLAQILDGRKTVEVRVGYENIRRLQPGDRLRLNDEHLVTILRIGRYAGFEELLDHEDPAAIAPDLSPSQLLPALRQIYPPDKEALGAELSAVTDDLKNEKDVSAEALDRVVRLFVQRIIGDVFSTAEEKQMLESIKKWAETQYEQEKSPGQETEK